MSNDKQSTIIGWCCCTLFELITLVLGSQNVIYALRAWNNYQEYNNYSFLSSMYTDIAFAIFMFLVGIITFIMFRTMLKD